MICKAPRNVFERSSMNKYGFHGPPLSGGCLMISIVSYQNAKETNGHVTARTVMNDTANKTWTILLRMGNVSRRMFGPYRKISTNTINKDERLAMPR
mmetsp:Transcript_169/g.140  ORF Transcript_169/g.140 Transcript_169/m.140 type:complete len:97 (-) Transcript_169:646-936(-)